MSDLYDLDQATIARAREMAALRTTADLRAYYAKQYPEGDPAHDIIQREPHSAFFGGAAAQLQELLWIIDRQRAAIERLDRVNAELAARAEYIEDTSVVVPMVCTACRNPVVSHGPNGWIHLTWIDGTSCPASLTGIKAMVEAGNENVPADV